MHQIKLFKNQHARDYVYEISIGYLLSRALHSCAELKLPQLVPDNGIKVNDLLDLFAAYDNKALIDLVNYLCAHSIFKIKDEYIYHTPLSLAINNNIESLNISIDAWCSAFDILAYVQQHQAQISKLYNNFSSKASLKKFRLCLESSDSVALILEMSHLYLASRMLMWLTSKNLFTHLEHKSVALSEIMNLLELKEDEQSALQTILAIMQRYQILSFNEKNQEYTSTQFGCTLSINATDSLYNAMLVIDEPWWNSAAYMLQGYLINAKAPFEECNQTSFYTQYIESANQTFQKAMACISLNEDLDVATSILQMDLSAFKQIIDIGGGHGGLLYHLYKQKPDLKYHLFEKDVPSNSNLTAAIMKHHNNFKPEVHLGDFKEKDSIPKLDSCLYIIKCCLHNYDKEDTLAILKNLREALGDKSLLLVAERIVPAHKNKPHLNRDGNLLMRLLFKAENHNCDFYKSALESAGFLCDKNTYSANNYEIFKATAARSFEDTLPIKPVSNLLAIPSPVRKKRDSESVKKTHDIKYNNSNTFP